MPKVCIVLATYNGEKYLAQMLDSLLSQTRKADIVIAVDDGSKDSSAEILEQYAGKLPMQIVKHAENLGHRAAFTHGLEQAIKQLAPSDLIAPADQDDIWVPYKLEIMERELINDPSSPSLVFGDAQIINSEGKTTHDSWRALANISLNTTMKHQIAGINHVNGCLSLFKASLLKTILPIPEGVTVHDRWIAMIAEKNGGIKAIPERVIMYRIHGENAVGCKVETSMSKTLQIQQIWVTTILENLTLLKLDHKEITFAQKLLEITKQRMTKSFLPFEFFWIYTNREFLFLKAPFLKTMKRVLFSLVGLPLAKKLWGKD